MAPVDEVAGLEVVAPSRAKCAVDLTEKSETQSPDQEEPILTMPMVRLIVSTRRRSQGLVPMGTSLGWSLPLWEQESPAKMQGGRLWPVDRMICHRSRSCTTAEPSTESTLTVNRRARAENARNLGWSGHY
jgi:hypothetical protein